MGALCASLVATHTLSHLEPWQDQFIISGLVCLGVVFIAFFFLRELSPQLRDQLMVTERERALVEARAMGIDVEKATTHPIRSMMKLDLITSSVAISVFLLFYYASVSVLTIYWVVTFNRTTPQANGINVWLAAFLSVGLVAGGLPVGLGRGAQTLHARRGDLRHGDDALPHPPDGPPPHGLLLQRLGDRAAGGVHRVRLRSVDGELHRAGRVAQPGADRVGAGRLGMDPAHHRRALVPGAALRHHDVDDAGGQPDGGATLQTIQAAQPYAPTTSPLEVQLRPRRPRSVITELQAHRSRAGPKTLATILQRCNIDAQPRSRR